MTLPNLRPDVELAARLFDTRKERSFDEVGITRAYGQGERMAQAEALGLEARSGGEPLHEHCPAPTGRRSGVCLAASSLETACSRAAI